jgi:hypothetical protein
MINHFAASLEQTASLNDIRVNVAQGVFDSFDEFFFLF